MELLDLRPSSLTPERIEACLPRYEISPEWEAKEERGELPEGVIGMRGMLQQVWPEMRFSEAEARWILALREGLSWRALAMKVEGGDNQITGMHLEEAALRALELGPERMER